jgi:hypothetical protein
VGEVLNQEEKMKKAIVCAVTVLALSLTAMASPKAKKQDLALFLTSDVAGTQLKPGQYQVSVEESQATLYRDGKAVATFPVRSETAAEKFPANSVLYDGPSSKVLEIRLGGTTTKLVLDGSNTSAAGSAGGRNK